MNMHNSAREAGEGSYVTQEPVESRHARQVPEGWKLVPMDATDEMIRSATLSSFCGPITYAAAYAEMVEAAPPAPSEEVE